MMLRAAVLGVACAVAVLLGGCAARTSSHSISRVPKIVGLQLRTAEDTLYTQHLRWRIAPGSHVFSSLLPSDVGMSTDDLPVIGQKPSAGTAAKPNAVVTIITPCTRKHPCA